MKIGLIGINKYAKFLNFACDLHVYAFQQYLAQNGYESTILDYKPAYFGKFDMREPAADAEAKYLQGVKRNADPAELKKLADLAVGYRSVFVERQRRFDKFELFAAERLSFTDEEYDSDRLEIEDPGFDCYICVTDVIWQTIPRHGFDRGFLLGSKAFEGKQKIAYAASRGASEDFSEPHAERFFDYLGEMDAISVREKDFSDYIEQRSALSAQTVADPVLLHTREFWDEVTIKPVVERYLLLYYVMEGATDTIAKAVEYAKLHDLTIVELSARPLKFGRITDPEVKHIARYDVGMEEWLGYIKHADAVFTNSFHGCCFAILFEKTFFVGARNGQKVPNLLDSFNLGDRRFNPSDDVRSLPHDIDYAAVGVLLEDARQRSGDFILGALEIAKSNLAAVNTRNSDSFDLRRRSLFYPLMFHSGTQPAEVVAANSRPDKTIRSKRHPSGATEYQYLDAQYRNDGRAVIPEHRFSSKDHAFAGWTLRFRVDNRWFWYLTDGTIEIGDVGGQKLEARKARFRDGDVLPHLPVNHVSVAVATAQWVPSNARAQSNPSTLPKPRAKGSIARRAYRKLRRAFQG